MEGFGAAGIARTPVSALANSPLGAGCVAFTGLVASEAASRTDGFVSPAVGAGVAPGFLRLESGAMTAFFVTSDVVRGSVLSELTTRDGSTFSLSAAMTAGACFLSSGTIPGVFFSVPVAGSGFILLIGGASGAGFLSVPPGASFGRAVEDGLAIDFVPADD